MRVDNDVAADRHDVVTGQAAPGIAVMDHPVSAADMADQHHHMMVARRHHAGGRRGAWEFPNPIGRQEQIPALLTKHVKRGLTAAKSMRTAGRPATDDIAVGIDNALAYTAIYGNTIRTAAIIADDQRRTLVVSVLGPRIRRGRRYDRKNHYD